MTGKIKRRSLRCGGRPKADFGSIFTTFIAPALGVAGSVADSAISKAQVSKSNTKPAVKETNTEVTNNNTSVENLPTTQAPTKDTISGLVTSNTVIPPDPTKTPTMRLGGRKKCWIGAAIMGATSIAGSLFGAAAQKREMRRQKSIKDWQDTTQEAANMTSALNNSQDYQEDYLRQFRTAARLGKRLGAKGIYITDGGDATKIDNNTYLLRGGSHEDVNETGQTGIGINVGGNEVEAEGGEVAQKKNGALRIFSAQPILNNGMSPAQAILRGYNKDKVFNAQQQFKKRNGLKDDGSKAAFGDLVTGTWNFLKQHRSPITNLAALAAVYQKFYPNSNYNKQKGKFGGGKGFNGSGAGGSWTNVKPATRKFNNFNDAYDDAVNRGASTFKFGNKLYNTKAEGNPIREINNRAVGSYRDTIMTNDRGKNYGVDFGPIKGPATLIPLVYDTYDRPRKIHRLGGGLTSKDRGSSKHPYPSVSSKDFAGGGRSYPIPTKAGTGMYIPFNKRYTSIYDAPNYDYDYNGGNVLGNDEVMVTAKRIKPTFMKPNNDAMNLIKVPKEEVPYIPQHHNRSRTIFSGGDYLGLGIDTLAALSTGLVNYNTAGKYTLPDRAPIIQASKLPTTYNVAPEIEEVKRYRDRLTGETYRNTSSSVAALNRGNTINLDALSNLSKLWATKENEENKMLTEDAKNQQTVAAQNVQNELARQSEIARIKNEAIQAKGDALNVGLSGLSQAWTNFWTAGRTAYEDDQSRRAMIASSKEATPTRLMEMNFDLSPDVIASLYKTAQDDRTKRFYLSRLSPKQRQKYGIN